MRSTVKLLLFLLILLTIQSRGQYLSFKKILNSGTTEFLAILADTNSNRIFASCSTSLYISENSGVSFGYMPVSISALLSVNSKFMVAGYDGYGKAILSSTNNGIDWESNSGTVEKIITALGSDGKWVYAGNNNGYMYCSKDMGKTWISLTSLPPGKVVSVIPDSQYLFAGVRDVGYYRSSDTGRTWTKMGSYSGTGHILKDKNRVLWLLSGSIAYCSSDNGNTWIDKKHFGQPSCLAIDRYDNLYCTDTTAGLFRSFDRGANWGLISDIKPQILSFRDSMILAVCNNDLYRYPAEDPVLKEVNMMPLAVGNAWQYMTYSVGLYGGTKEYSLYSRKIAFDTLIQGRKYYSYGSNTVLYRYDPYLSRLFYRSGSKERVYFDFSIPSGTNFKRYNLSDTSFTDYIVFKGSGIIYGQNRKTARLRTYYYINPLNEENYAEGIGKYEYSEWTYLGPDFTSTSNMTGALINNNEGNYSYYGGNSKPAISMTPVTGLPGRSSTLKLTCIVEHNLDRHNYSYGNSSDGIIYIDSVSFSYFYKKGEDNTPVRYVNAVRKGINGDYECTLPVDTLLIKNGYALMYNVTAKDKSIIPNYMVLPATGYFAAVYDPLLNVNDGYNQPVTFSLEQNYPNPFNPLTRIYYSIAEKGMVKLSVYNSIGQLMKELVSEVKEPGHYQAIFDGSSFSSGVYICRLISGNNLMTRKMVLLK